jgi:tRNA pseudouridine(38-40) synthase
LYNREIDSVLLRESLAVFRGSHDFRNFGKIRDMDSDNYVRTISEIGVESVDEGMHVISITANSFMYH